jgi:flagellar biosynthesis/type III secretory pathway M-ring protein FliF/YscJ
MLWWFLILGASAAVVVLVAMLLYVQVRHQLKRPATSPQPQLDDQNQQPPSAES